MVKCPLILRLACNVLPTILTWTCNLRIGGLLTFLAPYIHSQLIDHPFLSNIITNVQSLLKQQAHGNVIHT